MNYDTESWKRLAAEMKNLPVTQRAQLIHDSLTLALSGHLNSVTALEITASLKSEQAPEVWRTFYPLAERIRDRFQGTAASKNLDVQYFYRSIVFQKVGIRYASDIQVPADSQQQINISLVCIFRRT